ncbi:unnamed protein product, partial [Prorocentrum cordatum]
AASTPKGGLNQCAKHKGYYDSYMNGITWEQFSAMYQVEKTGITLDKAFEQHSNDKGPNFVPESVQIGQSFKQRMVVKYTAPTMSDLKYTVKQVFDWDITRKLLAGVPMVKARDPRTDQLEEFYLFPYDPVSDWPTWVCEFVLEQGQRKQAMSPEQHAYLNQGEEVFDCVKSTVDSKYGPTDSKYKLTVTWEDSQDRLATKENKRIAKLQSGKAVNVNDDDDDDDIGGPEVGGDGSAKQQARGRRVSCGSGASSRARSAPGATGSAQDMVVDPAQPSLVTVPMGRITKSLEVLSDAEGPRRSPQASPRGPPSAAKSDSAPVIGGEKVYAVHESDDDTASQASLITIAKTVRMQLKGDDATICKDDPADVIVADHRKRCDLWKAMELGNQGDARHQATLAARRLREKKLNTKADTIDAWTQKHAKVEELSHVKIFKADPETVNNALKCALLEFDRLPLHVEVDLVTIKARDARMRCDLDAASLNACFDILWPIAVVHGDGGNGEPQPEFDWYDPMGSLMRCSFKDKAKLFRSEWTQAVVVDGMYTQDDGASADLIQRHAEHVLNKLKQNCSEFGELTDDAADLIGETLLMMRVICGLCDMRNLVHDEYFMAVDSFSQVNLAGKELSPMPHKFYCALTESKFFGKLFFKFSDLRPMLLDFRANSAMVEDFMEGVTEDSDSKDGSRTFDMRDPDALTKCLTVYNTAGAAGLTDVVSGFGNEVSKCIVNYGEMLLEAVSAAPDAGLHCDIVSGFSKVLSEASVTFPHNGDIADQLNKIGLILQRGAAKTNTDKVFGSLRDCAEDPCDEKLDLAVQTLNANKHLEISVAQGTDVKNYVVSLVKSMIVNPSLDITHSKVNDVCCNFLKLVPGGADDLHALATSIVSFVACTKRLTESIAAIGERGADSEASDNIDDIVDLKHALDVMDSTKPPPKSCELQGGHFSDVIDSLHDKAGAESSNGKELLTAFATKEVDHSKNSMATLTSIINQVAGGMGGSKHWLDGFVEPRKVNLKTFLAHAGKTIRKSEVAASLDAQVDKLLEEFASTLNFKIDTAAIREAEIAMKAAAQTFAAGKIIYYFENCKTTADKRNKVADAVKRYLDGATTDCPRAIADFGKSICEIIKQSKEFT